MTSNSKVRVALVGISGYGHFYLRELLAPTANQRVHFTGAIDPFPERSPFREQLQAAQIPIYPDLATFYKHALADLVVIAAPIHWHAPLTLQALAHQSHVLCEKPLCATIQEVQQLRQAEEDSDHFVAIGYQWSFSEAIQTLKRDIQAGLLGRPIRLKARVFWPRWQPYYQRNAWAGRIKTEAGAWVLDSPVNNATAHYLHNMFYVLGERRESSAFPIRVQAELYRANAIENYDTAALRCYTDQGVELLFYTAHPVSTTVNPIFQFEFEEAVVTYDQDQGGRIIASFHAGHCQDYGNPFATNAHKLWQSVEAVHTQAPVACGVEAATAQTLCMNGAQDSMADIIDFPTNLVQVAGDKGWVQGLPEAFTDCYEQNILPSEDGNLPWAEAGEIIDLQKYHFFPSI